MRWQRETFRRIFPFHLALGAVLGAWIFFAAFGGVADPDIWWHILNAKYLFAHGSLPRFDSFSYTTLGTPWMDHEWLTEVPYYLAWHAFGLQGIYVLLVVLIEIILIGVFYIATKYTGNVKGAFLVSCLSVLLAIVSFGPRTLLFGWLYLVVLLGILMRFRTTGNGPLWVLPLLFCVWINSHGSWLIGMVVFGIFIAAGLVEGHWGKVDAIRWSPKQLRRLLAIGGASAAALFINPFGYRLVYYPFDLAFRQKLTVSNVQEWQSVDFHTPRGKIVVAVILALLIAALLSRARWKLEEVVLCMFGIYTGVTYMRFLFLAAIVLTPLLTKFLDCLPPYNAAIDKPYLNVVIFAGILCIVIVKFPSEVQLEKGVEERFPVAAITYLEQHPLQGNLFNYYMWGGYITFRRPDIKTFVDSRSDIYEYRGVLQEYLDVVSLKKSMEVLDKYRVRYVLFPPDDPLAYLLRQQPGWKIQFEDKVSALFERIGPMPTSPSDLPQAGLYQEEPTMSAEGTLHRYTAIRFRNLFSLTTSSAFAP